MEAGPTYCYTRLKGAQRNWQPLFDQLTAATLPALADAGVKRWGAWSGLFGIGSNELVLMTFADATIDHVQALNAHIAGAPASIPPMAIRHAAPILRIADSISLDLP